MAFVLLFKDELNGFYKSKVMIFLWAGLPVLSVLLFLVAPSSEDISLSALTAILVGSLGGG